MSITQISLTVFLLFAVSRVFLRFRGGSLSLLGFVFWTILFNSAIIAVLFPVLTSQVAVILGIGRGADAILYTSVVILFYLVFRLYVYIKDIRLEITELVSKLALKRPKKHDRKTSKH